MSKEKHLLEGRTVWINGKPFDGFSKLEIKSQAPDAEGDIYTQIAKLSGHDRFPRTIDLTNHTLHLNHQPSAPIPGHSISPDEFTQFIDPKSSHAVIKNTAYPKDAPCPELVQAPTDLELKTLTKHKPTGITFYDLQNPRLEAIMFRHLTSAVFIPTEELNAIVFNKTRRTLILWWNDVKQNIFSVYPEESIQIIPLFK